MNKNKALTVASVIFGVIALAHLFRAVLNWNVTIETFAVPVYFSYILFVISAFLSWIMYYNTGKK